MKRQGNGEVLTAQEAAELLRKHPNQIYELLNRGEIPGAKLGGTWRLSRTALMELMQQPKEATK